MSFFVFKKHETNGNGISDTDEDFDCDGLSNLLECRYRTSPYNTDTEGDGALDGWEIANSCDPLTFNASFIVSRKTAEVSKENPVSATIQIQFSGSQIDSFGIEAVSLQITL